MRKPFGRAASVGVALIAGLALAVAGVLVVAAEGEPSLECEDPLFSSTSYTHDASLPGAATLAEAIDAIDVQHAIEGRYTTPDQVAQATSLADAFIDEAPVAKQPEQNDPDGVAQAIPVRVATIHVFIPVEGRYRIEAWVQRDDVPSFKLTSATVCW